MLRARLATAAVAIPLLIWLICWGPIWLFAAFVLLVTFVGLTEIAGMALEGRGAAQALTVLGGLVIALAVVRGGPDAVGMATAVVLVGGLLLSLLDPDMPGAAIRLGHGLVAALYVGFLLPHVVSLRLLDGGERWVFFAIACSMGADTGGYFAGRFFGRNKLFPRVSPAKTVEGAVGAVAGGILLSAFAWAVYRPSLAGAALHLDRAMLLGLVLAILAQAGDLVESMLKRAYGAKDSGWILPGHGGILDRIDSLVLPFVFTYHLNAGLRFD